MDRTAHPHAETGAAREAAGPPAASAAPRIAHVVTSVDEEAAGTAYSVPALCRGLSAAGGEVVMFTAGAPLVERRSGFTHERIALDHPGLPLVHRLKLSRGIARRVEAGRFDVVHGHGLWEMPLIHADAGARRTGAPHVIAPRGMLSPAALAFSRGRKRLFDALVQRRVLERAALFHATSEEEVEDIRRYRLTAPVAVVPNGIDVPDLAPAPGGGADGGEGTLVLSLGRIHPKKGLDRLVRAFALVEAAFADASLLIAGPDAGGHADALRALAADLGTRRVRIRGPVYGAEKDALYARADLFVLPTLGDNFAMTVAESLAAGTPVIASRGAPWSGLARERCGWWVDHGPGPLAAALAEALALPADERRAMGRRGREWMLRDFAWSALAARMESAYRWLLGAGERPAFVHAGP